VPTYLVESYLPKAASPSPSAISAVLSGSLQVRHRWSLFVPDEEIWFHVLDGSSAEVIREATLRAQLRCERISRAVLVAADESTDPTEGEEEK